MSMTWGDKLKLTIFGESHGVAIGIVIDNIPAGINLDLDMIRFEMKRRSPGNNPLGTTRQEKDEFEILSGVFNDFTTGAPISIIIRNNNTRSKDYGDLSHKMRPSHSDYGAYVKYNGYNDYRGGGKFSARITAGLVFAGAICKQILNNKNISVCAHIQSIGNINDDKFSESSLNTDFFNKLFQSNFPLINSNISKDMISLVDDVRQKKDSVGGVIECAILGVNAGFGNPFFDSIESRISSLAFSIPGVKGIEFGLGFDISKNFGSVVNDELFYDGADVKTTTNNNGGVVGGITNGMPIIFRCAFKPTASIGIEQNTIDIKTKENSKLSIVGRHDPCIAIRAVPILESIAAIAILNELL